VPPRLNWVRRFHGFGGRIEIGAAGVLAGVETGGAGFGTVDQGTGRLGQRHAGQQAGSEEERF